MKIQENNWQANELNSLVEFLKAQDNVIAVILKGSVVDHDFDYWSDIDIIVIVKELNQNTDWIEKYKPIFTFTTNASPARVTQRLVFNDFSRIDLILVNEEAFNSDKQLVQQIVPSNAKLLFTKNEAVRIQVVAEVPDNNINPDISKELVDTFWFKSTLAITKVMRNDLLIANHLLLDLWRDYFVALMISRDKDLGTNHHRFGGKYNEYVRSIDPIKFASKTNIIEAIDVVTNVFEKFIAEVKPEYSGKYITFKLFMDKARTEVNN